MASNERTDGLQITQDTSEFTVQWSLNNWSQLKGTARGQKISSPLFEYSSQKWNIDFYPNGYKSSSSGFSSLFLLVQDKKSIILPIELDFDLFAEKEEERISFKTSYIFDSEAAFESWGFTDFMAISKLESKFVMDNTITVGIKIRNEEQIKIEQYLVPFSKKLYENSKNGDLTICCKDSQILRADYIILIHDAFFNANFDFQELHGDKKLAPIQLVDYSADSVSRMIHFLYTGITSVSEKLDLRCELYCLADYTTNFLLCDLVIKELVKRDFQSAKIMDLLLQLRFKPFPLRKLAVEYYQKNRASIVKEEGYEKKLDLLLGAEGDPVLVREMLS